MAHNLCFTTLLQPRAINKFNLTLDQYIKTLNLSKIDNISNTEHNEGGSSAGDPTDLLIARKKAKADLKKRNSLSRRGSWTVGSWL